MTAFCSHRSQNRNKHELNQICQSPVPDCVPENTAVQLGPSSYMRNASQETLYHPPPSADLQLCYKAQPCVCLFMHLNVCNSFACFMRTVDEMCADIVLFGLCPVHLAHHLCLLPDPVNWCIPLVSKWPVRPVSPVSVSILSLWQK